MFTPTYYHNPNCSKSREGLLILKNSNTSFTLRNFIEAPLSIEELKELLHLHEDPIQLLRDAKGDESDEQILSDLSKDQTRLQRPLLRYSDGLIILRPVDLVHAFISTK